MTKTIVHMIGQAHLDPAWLGRWTEGCAISCGLSGHSSLTIPQGGLP